MEPLHIPVNVQRLHAYAVGMALMLALSVVIMFSLERVMLAELRIATMVIGFLGSTLAGYGMFYFVMRARQAPPVVSATPEALQFDASFINRGSVPWANVKDYAMVRHAGRNLVLINLKDPFLLTDSASGLTRRLFLANLKRYRTPVALPAALFQGDASERLGQIAAYGRQFS